MEITPNTNIKIVRLQSGEDIVADFIEDDENDVVMLNNPMHIIFKRIPTGQTVMMMMPWLPIELIKSNSALIYTSDILTVIEPKEELIDYYGNVVCETEKRMSERTSLDQDYEDDADEEMDEEEYETIMEAMKEQKKYNKIGRAHV